ncbi:hypothetical protein FACS189452_10110 [Bacteroidia bacterium]|nr:hypothetical protein FACS189452_10110 [Bacteroidia bacterium]
MKTKPMITAVAMIATMGACTTEDYYRSANRSPELSSTANLDAVDTIKTSTKSEQRTYIFPITAQDENGNMNTLMVNATGGDAVILVDGEQLTIEAIEVTKDRFNFTRNVEFTPNSDGKHTVSVRVKDDFGNIASLEKMVYSFTNMRPKAGLSIPHERFGWDAVLYTFDFSNSFDRDAKWGGAIDSTIVKAVCTDYIEDDGSFYTEWYKFDVSTYGLVTPSYLLYDDGVLWMTDIYAWVIDSEGAVSDTVHFSLGHVD